MYHKVCKYCGKEFDSESRNKRYCSDECCEKAQEVNKKKTKRRKVRRKEYDENKEVMRLLAKSYKVAHEVADLLNIPKQCVHGTEEDSCVGELRLHHKDFNCLNNDPRNLEWICEHHHKQEDDKHNSVNMKEVLKDSLEYPDGIEKYKDIMKLLGI